MSRFRVMLLTTGLFVISAGIVFSTWAQAQGPGGGQGRGGRGGFGGPGGPGGFGFGGPGGFGGDSLLSLATRAVVQEELKVTDKQRTQITSLNDDYNQRRQKLFEEMRNNGGQGQGGNNRGGRNRGGAAQNNGGGGGNNAAAANGGFTSSYELNPYAVNTSQEPEQNQAPQQDERMARFQAMRTAMEQLDQQANSTLGKILNSKQYQRLNQIQIQAQGVNALVRADVAEKINLDETQVESIQAVLNDSRSAQRDAFAKGRDVFRNFRNQNGGGNNGNNPATKDNSGNANANGGQNGGNNGGGNRRRGGGPGGPGGGNFDPEAMRKFMEQPEVKAQMSQMQTEREKIEAKTTQAVNKILTKYQLASFNKLKGAPFDVSKLRGGFGGPGGNATPKADASTKTAEAKTEADAKGDTKASAATNATSETKKSTTAKSKAKSSTKRRYTQRQLPPGVTDDSGVGGDFSVVPNQPY